MKVGQIYFGVDRVRDRRLAMPVSKLSTLAEARKIAFRDLSSGVVDPGELGSYFGSKRCWKRS